MTNGGAEINITVADFRECFPELANFTDAQIEMAVTEACCYISNKVVGEVSADCRAMMIKLCAAHLLNVSAATVAADGAGSLGVAGQIVDAAIDSVSISVAHAKNNTPFEYFFNQSGYGQRLLALIRAKISPMYYWGSRRRVL